MICVKKTMYVIKLPATNTVWAGVLESTNWPPNHRIIQSTNTPKNSDIGEARSRLKFILFLIKFSLVLVPKNFEPISFSALKALIILSPVSVSSNIDIKVPNCSCDCVDCFFRDLLTLPIINPITGSSTSRNNDNCGLIKTSIVK